MFTVVSSEWLCRVTLQWTQELVEVSLLALHSSLVSFEQLLLHVI